MSMTFLTFNSKLIIVGQKRSKTSKFPKVIKLDINGKKAIEPQGTNYREVLRNTDLWQNYMKGV